MKQSDALAQLIGIAAAAPAAQRAIIVAEALFSKLYAEEQADEKEALYLVLAIAQEHLKEYCNPEGVKDEQAACELVGEMLLRSHRS